jgi:predicted phosphodiesterase
MRYALISDIHANLEAFEAVLDGLSHERIDEYLCLGDVIGYGADPKRCLELVRSLKPSVLIAGNHEWGVAGLKGLDYFNDLAREAVIWTKGVLDQKETDSLKSFPLTGEKGALTLVHGTLDSPADFNYIFNGHDACQTARLMKTPLCVVGHSHVAGIFCFHGNEIRYSPKAVKIDRDKRYVVNAGSVGQPRDLDPRASCAVYDDEEATIEIKRMEYDIKAAQGKILQSGLPERLALRLAEGT